MKRQFILGEEWLYYKAYCGKRSADLVLTEAIKPLSEEMLNAGYMDRWFFVRYSDPEPHLRLRFRLTENRHIGSIIEAIKVGLKPFITDGVIWSLQTDTYNRELERYGTGTMEETEYIFFLDSQLCVGALSLIEDDRLAFLLALNSVDRFLNLFHLNISEKVDFTRQNFVAFKQEFQADKQLNKQLNLKYQALKGDIHMFLTTQVKEYNPLFNLLDNRDINLKKIVELIDLNLQTGAIIKEDYLKHQVHMMLNRIFRDKQRLHELLCYSCLYRFYQSQKNAV